MTTTVLQTKIDKHGVMSFEKTDLQRVTRCEGQGRIWAVGEPIMYGERLANCDVLIWEQGSDYPTRCHEGLFQAFLKWEDSPTGRWVTEGRLLAKTDSWKEMYHLLQVRPAWLPAGVRVVVILAYHYPAHTEGGPG